MRLYTDILRDIRKGAAVEEATNALAEVVRAVDETGKPGSITVTIKITPAKHGGPEKTLQAEVKAKKPIADIAPAIFFSDAGGRPDAVRSAPGGDGAQARSQGRGCRPAGRNDTMKLGDRVMKRSGDYLFAGVIVSDFTKTSGVRRLVVEDDRGLLLILNEGQLTLLTEKEHT